jgi:mRNA interferase RelE/StbE
VYRVEFDPEAERDLLQLHRQVAKRILKKLRWLAENVERITPEPLHRRLRGKYKLRVGDYRVIYTLNRKQQKIRVHMVGHRDQIYKSRKR